jgi:rod shape-determining protein MreD
MGPYLSIADRIVLAVRMVLPYSVLVALFFMGLISAPYPFSAILDTPFFLMAIYFWAIYRPTLLPSWLAFLSGLLLDILSGVPLGLNALLFVLIRMIIVDQRRFLLAQSFMMIWLGFAFVDIGYHIAQWLLFSLMAFRFMPIEDLWVVMFLGFAFFPLVNVILHITHKALPAPTSQPKAGLNTQRKGVSF